MRQDTMAKKLYLGYEVVKGREPIPSDYLSLHHPHFTGAIDVKAGDTIPVDDADPGNRIGK